MASWEPVQVPRSVLGCSGCFWPPQGASWLLELCRGSIGHEEVGLGCVAWCPERGGKGGATRTMTLPPASGQPLSIIWTAGPSVPRGWPLQCCAGLLAGGQREINMSRHAPGGAPHTWCQQLLIGGSCHRVTCSHRWKGREWPYGPVAFRLFNMVETFLQRKSEQ